MVTAPESQGLCSGFKFDPTDEMLVEHYLPPYLRGDKLSLAGVVFVDDPRRLPPWLLLDHHGRGGGDGDSDREGAYFIAPAPAVGQDGRQRKSRFVAGGGRWVKQQKAVSEGKVVVGGETFRWEKCSLNFHRNVDRRSCSTGWVMHEIAVVQPPGSAVAATHRACHIAFTGHRQKRKRVPDGYVVDAVKKEAVDQEQGNRDQEESNKQLLPALEQSNLLT